MTEGLERLQQLESLLRDACKGDTDLMTSVLADLYHEFPGSLDAELDTRT
jgi:hypothetical protein